MVSRVMIARTLNALIEGDRTITIGLKALVEAEQADTNAT
jgi:hypothetical protein